MVPQTPKTGRHTPTPPKPYDFTPLTRENSSIRVTTNCGTRETVVMSPAESAAWKETSRAET